MSNRTGRVRLITGDAGRHRTRLGPVRACQSIRRQLDAR